MSEWPVRKVEDLVDAGILERPMDGNHGEIHPKGTDFVSYGIPFIMASDLKDGRVDLHGCKFITESQANSLRKGFSVTGDVLLSHKATIGRSAVVQDIETPFVMLTPQVTFYRIKDATKLNPYFLKYYFDSKQFKDIFSAWAGAGSTRAYLGITGQLKLPIACPPIEVQMRIVDTVGPIDKKIELNRRMNDTLQSIARAIFKDWFVDFGPVRAKTEGRPPYLSSDIWSLFPDALDDEDKPIGWEASTLNNIASLNPETWSARNAPISVTYVDLANTKWGTIESTIVYTWTEAPSRARRVLRSGDTIVGTVRPGNGSFALVSDEDLTGSTGFAVLRPKKPYYREYVYCAATSSNNIERLSHLADGAAYPAVRPDVVSATEMIMANDEIIRAFSSLTAGLIDRMQHNKRENQSLAKFRGLLLPKLMSGEIRLREAEKVVQEVA